MPCVGRGHVVERNSALKQWILPVDADKYLENKLCMEVQLVVGLLSFCCFFSSCSKAADILFPDFLPEPSIKSLATKCERLKREWLLNEEAALNYSEILPLPLFLFLMFWISSTFLAVNVFRKYVLKEQLQCVRVFETKAQRSNFCFIACSIIEKCHFHLEIWGITKYTSSA